MLVRTIQNHNKDQFKFMSFSCFLGIVFVTPVMVLNLFTCSCHGGFPQLYTVQESPFFGFWRCTLFYLYNKIIRFISLSTQMPASVLRKDRVDSFSQDWLHGWKSSALAKASQVQFCTWLQWVQWMQCYICSRWTVANGCDEVHITKTVLSI